MIRFHHTKKWKKIINISIVLILAILILEMLFHSTIESINVVINLSDVLWSLDIIVTLILALDIILWYNEAKNKYNFVRRNIVKIIAVFPFMLVFRGLQILRIEEVFAFAFSGETIKEILTFERVLRFEKGIKIVSKATEFMSDILQI